MAVNQLQLTAIPRGYFSFGREADWDHLQAVASKFDIPVDWLLKELPARQLQVAAYFIASVPVTFGMMASYIRSSVGYPRVNALLAAHMKRYPAEMPAFPVTPEEAERFCSWLSHGHRTLQFGLPTEVEWEKAAKGLDGREYPWGNADNVQVSNTTESGRPLPDKTNNLSGNLSYYRVRNMGGGVEEWTASRNLSYACNPIGVPDNLHYRILRGGTCEHKLDLARCTRRHGNIPSLFSGFRVAARYRSSLAQPGEVYNRRFDPSPGGLIYVKLMERIDRVRVLGSIGTAGLVILQAKQIETARLERAIRCGSELIALVEHNQGGLISGTALAAPDLYKEVSRQMADAIFSNKKRT